MITPCVQQTYFKFQDCFIFKNHQSSCIKVNRWMSIIFSTTTIYFPFQRIWFISIASDFHASFVSNQNNKNIPTSKNLHLMEQLHTFPYITYANDADTTLNAAHLKMHKHKTNNPPNSSQIAKHAIHQATSSIPVCDRTPHT